jgi:uncharacterized damage-inducible protein DinB
MHPDQAKPLSLFLLPQLQSEQAITKKIVSAVPRGQESFKPGPKCRSTLQLAWHICVVEIWFLDAVIQQHFGETSPKPAGVNTCLDVAQWYDENFARRVPNLDALSGEDLAKPVDFIGLRNDPAVAYLNIALRHSVHHRGQLSTYLRAMGAKVPAIYVESGDEPFPSADGSTTTPPAF